MNRFHLFNLMPDGEYLFVCSLPDLNGVEELIQQSPSLVYLGW